MKAHCPLPQATERTTPPEGQGLVSRWHLCAKAKTALASLLLKDMALSQSMWLGKRKMDCLQCPLTLLAEYPCVAFNFSTSSAGLAFCDFPLQ